jgi:cation transport regulator ChaB
MPARDELPSTIRRSPKKAREIWSAAHDSAVEQYGEGERTHRIVFAALKRSFEKVGDHWEAKAEGGPSDPQAARGGVAARRSSAPTAGGVDANASKQHLVELARRLENRGRSQMTKPELV